MIYVHYCEERGAWVLDWIGLDGLAGYGSRFFSFISFSFWSGFLLLLLLLLFSESETRFVSIINLHLTHVDIRVILNLLNSLIISPYYMASVRLA